MSDINSEEAEYENLETVTVREDYNILDDLSGEENYDELSEEDRNYLGEATRHLARWIENNSSSGEIYFETGIEEEGDQIALVVDKHVEPDAEYTEKKVSTSKYWGFSNLDIDDVESWAEDVQDFYSSEIEEEDISFNGVKRTRFEFPSGETIANLYNQK